MIDRQPVIDETRSWVGTPYELRQMVKGAGVDCGLLPYAVYRKFNLIPEFRPEWLAGDWFANTSDERYLLMIERYLQRLVNGHVDSPAPGCLALTRTTESRVFNHAGIITAWPRLVHAIPDCVVETNALSDIFWTCREIIIFDPLINDQQNQ